MNDLPLDDLPEKETVVGKVNASESFDKIVLQILAQSPPLDSQQKLGTTGRTITAIPNRLDTSFEQTKLK
ncbi:hypothetical protein Q31b_34880 [Novipirellula aureliae]|uniref:Uncharacterized protein n=1 Tax=Novipirellula aureliae TaxID=2527966 RepID=A0A5C6DS45_9BACT|nr:hypothetical protein [Novipirellula aureliae]TWU40143.1 hypothetical protein Q31b_34880 [Novipirellula aureliae]